MPQKDPYSAIKRSLPLLDHMHRFLLPGISRDMAAIIKRKGVKRVLDVACGTGYTVCALHRRGIEVDGVDMSKVMLLEAAQKAGDCRFVRGNGISLPFKTGSHDGALVGLALHEMFPAVRNAVWAEMKRVVRPDGFLFVFDFAKLPGKKNPLSRVIGRSILAVEKSTLKFDPDHWRNSLHFQGEGVLMGWLDKAGDKAIETRSYLGGNIVLAVVVSKKFEI